MRMTEDQKVGSQPINRRKFLLFLAFVLFGSVASSVLWSRFTHRPFSGGMVMGPVVAIAFLGGWAAFTGKAKVPGAPPEPVASELRSLLDADGLEKVQLRYADQGDAANYPRPIVQGMVVVIPARVLREFSAEALAWSVRTDAKASVLLWRRATPVMAIAMLLLMFALALLERARLEHQAIGWMLAGLLLLFVWFGVAGYRYQLRADRATRTDSDRTAAREALLISYKAQRARATSEKWLFPSRELRSRARALGIDLEKS